MATRPDYRADLEHKLLALEDGGYGDFAYEAEDFNLFLEMAMARLYPAVYQRKSEVCTLTTYGTRGLTSITPVNADVVNVYRIEDANERIQLTGWMQSGLDIVGIDTNQIWAYAAPSAVTVFYHTAFTLPDDDVTLIDLPHVYKPLVILGALIEALESRQDTGVRGDPTPQGQFIETQLIDRLTPRYEALKKDLAMSLPGVQL